MIGIDGCAQERRHTDMIPIYMYMYSFWRGGRRVMRASGPVNDKVSGVDSIRTLRMPADLDQHVIAQAGAERASEDSRVKSKT